MFFLLALTSCDLFNGGTTLETTSKSTEITSTTMATTTTVITSQATVGKWPLIYSGCSYIYVRTASIPTGCRVDWNPDNILVIWEYTG